MTGMEAMFQELPRRRLGVNGRNDAPAGFTNPEVGIWVIWTALNIITMKVQILTTTSSLAIQCVSTPK